MKLRTLFVTILIGLAGYGTPQAQGGPAMNVLYLDGKSGYVTLPPRVFEGLTEATVEAWVRWERFTRWGQVFDFGREGNAVLLQNEEASSTVQFVIYDRKGKSHRAKVEKTITPGVWYHLATVCGPGGMQIYVNGKLADSDRYEGGLDQVADESNLIGKSNWPGDELFQGYVAEFRVWGRRLAQSEIASRMDRLAIGREPGLAGCWHFNRVEGTAVRDEGPSGLHGSLAEGARIVSVPAIARYLVPGELDRAAANVYASGRANMKPGGYITAYRDFTAALDLAPGFQDADSLMRVAVEKGRYRLAVLPVTIRGRVEIPRPGTRLWETLAESGTLDLLRQEEGRAALEEQINKATQSELLKALPPYVEPVVGNRLDWDLKGRGLDAQTANPAQIVQALMMSGIPVAVFGEVEVASLRYDTGREAQKAFLVREVAYLDDKGKEKKRKEKAGEHTYYIVKKDAWMTCRMNYRIVDVETGEVLKADSVEEESSDRVEFADPNGIRREDLYVERYGGLRRLDGEDDRFRAREKLRDRAGMIAQAAEMAGGRMAEGVLSFTEGYTPAVRSGK